ncbi:MAG: serine--tRNA ligase [Candidatus Hepatoplasma vulgare]|nr:MAG: serine--tRNA ligase [Candidatus Hepatoplasma sp.]
MLNIKEFVENKDKYKELLKRKSFNDFDLLDKLINSYKLNLEFMKNEEDLRYKLNLITSEIRKDKKNKILHRDASILSNKIRDINNKRSEINEFYRKDILRIPNLPLEETPIGNTEKDNVVLKEINKFKKNKNIKYKPHWEILEEKRLILKNEASQLSGRRHVIFRDKAALLVRAIETYMLEKHYKNNYEIIDPPLIVNKEMLINTGQLPNFKEDLFELKNGQYLIPTAEVPLTNLVANKILDEKVLPLNYSAFTDCFRNERVAAGQDARGIIRLFQFRKVEIVKIGKREDYPKDFENLLNDAKSILDDFKLPYRLLELSTGDLSFSSKRTIDLEVFFPGINEYKEVSSISFIGDFQARRMKTRYKKEDGTKAIPFTYNGSALAIERIFAAILENYLNENGDILIPEILKKYLPFKKI